MNFTAGLLLLFLNIFLPGLLFLRFYFTGEFSKQFSTKVPLIRLAFYAFIPGLIIQLIGILFYNLWDKNFTILHALEIFSDLMGQSKNYDECTEHFLENKLSIYAYYTLVIAFFSVLSGVFLHWLIRTWKLDIYFKILRFKNQWYYVFNGDVLKYKKYKAVNIINPDESINNDIMLVYADILVNESGSTKLYSGIVMDYDLSHSDTNSLDKIYLIDAHRYKKRKDENENVVVTKKQIPGQIFIILNSNILNMNLTYVPLIIHKINIDLKKENRKTRIKSFQKKLQFPSFLFVIYFFIALFLPQISFPPIDYLANEFNIIQKIFFILTILSTMSILFYDQNLKEEEYQKYKNARETVGIFIVINIFMILFEIFV